ncbi:hypothetical protein GQ457_12G018040 [Hibiscus cannabinus]
MVRPTENASVSSLSSLPDSHSGESPEQLFSNKRINLRLDDTNFVLWKQQLSTTRVMHLHYRLRAIKKADLTMRAYTMQIKEICDLLASCGSLVSLVEQIATILNGLPSVYDPFVAVILANKEPYTVEGVVSMFVDAETVLADPLRFPFGINTPSFSDATPRSESSQCVNMRPYKSRSHPQCQLCGKLDHKVDRCWHRFDHVFKGVTSFNAKPTDTQANALSYTARFEVPYDPIVPA